jgi:hypothetical protein
LDALFTFPPDFVFVFGGASAEADVQAEARATLAEKTSDFAGAELT